MHTPLPWRFEKELDSYQYIKTPFYIRTVASGDLGDYLIATGGLQAEDTMDNARLIAAAPDLLEALEDARRAIASLPFGALGFSDSSDGEISFPLRNELLDKMNKAIEKAKE